MNDHRPQTTDQILASNVEVLALVNGRYELVKRSRIRETAASRLLPGFGVSVGYLFRGE